MQEFEQRRYTRRVFLSRSFFVLLLCLVVLLFFSVFNIYQKSRQADARNKLVEEQIKVWEQRKGELEANLNSLKTQTGAEEELRKKFQIEKEGEEYVVILEKLAETQAGAEPQKESWFNKILNFLRD